MYGGAEKANAATSYKRALCDIQVFHQRPELFPCIFWLITSLSFT